MSNPKVTLYYVGTPNGVKISIALELLKLPYKLHTMDFGKNEQKEPWFLKINPNGRIPAIVDHQNNDFPVFESGAILLYLADKYDPENKLLPKDENLKSEAIQWLMWQMGGLGPMMGQLGYFNRAEEKIPYAINRYKTETERLFSVLESKLGQNNYLVGNTLTLADIASFGWVRGAPRLGLDFEKYPGTKKWIDTLEEHPDFKAGLNAGKTE